MQQDRLDHAFYLIYLQNGTVCGHGTGTWTLHFGMLLFENLGTWVGEVGFLLSYLLSQWHCGMCIVLAYCGFLYAFRQSLVKRCWPIRTRWSSLTSLPTGADRAVSLRPNSWSVILCLTQWSKQDFLQDQDQDCSCSIKCFNVLISLTD